MKAHTRWLVAAALALVPAGGCRTAPAATVDHGEYLFRNYCSSCHGADAYGNPDIAAPAVAGLPEWYVERQLHGFREGHRGADYDDIEGMRMRPMALTLGTDTDITAVARYVASLTPTRPAATLGGDAANGAKLFATCTACHQADGKGNEALGAPPLTQTHDWYLLTQLKKFKGKDRGATAGDTYGAQMLPMAAGLADEQAMKDVIAHIQTLK